MRELVKRQAAIDAVKKHYRAHDNDLLELIAFDIERLPSAQPEDWMERNKERILQAGMEGREIEFRIGGRLFAIREKAQ